MRKYLLAFSALLMFQFAYGKEYGNYEPKRILQLSETPSGKSASIDFAYFDKMLSDLSIHAKNYPPQFDTIQDKNRAIQDVTMLSGLLDILMTTGFSGNPEFLVRAGYLNSPRRAQ